jgi:hypothetical protein
MTIREDMIEMKKDVEEIKKQGFAFEILSDYKKANKRIFIALIIVLVMWFITLGYLVYILNDIGTIETSQEIEDIDTINNSTIQNGGN